MAQALRGTTGLLHAPTADMQQDKTVLIGGNILHLEPLQYITSNEIKYTFDYYLNVTFFPWLEVGYTCTLNYAEHGSSYFPQRVWGKYSNQDRSFNIRLRLWKEGWWKKWTPQIVLGLDDPTSHERYGGGTIKFDSEGMQNNYFTRYYLAATKHVDVKNVGNVGVHLSYLTNKGRWQNRNRGVAVGINYKMELLGNGSFWLKALNGFNWMAEYDTRACNVGVGYTFWTDHINLIAELYDGEYFSGGIQFKVHLK
jgi:hypothetical protein